eukprot:m.476804 g.476804  ORF g.476804 m.476804 type:complete len:56 (-) comp41861_c0_seq1:61-228(-)
MYREWNRKIPVSLISAISIRSVFSSRKFYLASSTRGRNGIFRSEELFDPSFLNLA